MKLLPSPGAHRRRHVLPRTSFRRLSIPRPLLPRPSLPRPSWPGPSFARTGDRKRPVEQRRARALLLAAVVFAAAVLLSALPWATLANQHAQLTSASTEVNELQAENHALAVQARQLSSNATQAGLARQDYGLVKAGQKAYDLLPGPGTTAPSVTDAGHVPLDEPPVVPGSRRSEELLGAGAGSATSSTSVGSSARTSAGPVQRGLHPTGEDTSSTRSLDAGGFWSRVGHTLEFWN